MADAIVSAVLEQLVAIVGPKVEQEVRLVVGVEKEVKKMKSTFEAIKDVLEDAENRQYLSEGKAVKAWLDELKHISFDTDDVLDEWKTAILKSKIERDQAQSPSTPSLLSKVRSCIPFPCSSFRGVALRRDIAGKIKKLNEDLQDISRKKESFSFVTGQKSLSDQNFERPNTKSLIDESKVFGRDDDRNKLIRLLLSDNYGGGGSGEGIPVIAIVGMGGLGKTTLAQLAYNNGEVKKHFSQKRIWVCVSDPFDEVRIAKAILEALEGKSSNFNEPENLLREIHQKIEGEKFLLVLDDVWTKDEKKWEPLMLSLLAGSKESRILVTTRNEDVARLLGCLRPVSLRVLSCEDSWLLFSKIAFSERSNQNENLESIGRKLVSRCAGLPLAIKTIASLLRLKAREDQWQSILDSEMWNLEEVRKNLYAPLLLSYYDLPVTEKQCFRYCAIFPKDDNIERDELIKLWMAQGFLGETRKVNDLEIMGVECFHNLAIRGFFQEFDERIDGSIRCKMHDIVHDFAQFLTEKECLLEESEGGIEVQKRIESSGENVRYLTLINPPGNHVPILDPFKKLRSFLIRITVENDESISFASFLKLFDQLINLRMLSFHNEGSEEEHSLVKIPKEIGKLIHLRYLSLEGNKGLCELPEELCGLCNLQTLNIRCCEKLQNLPRGMEKLINLRHLQNEDTSRLLVPKEMQRLPCLHTLEEFYVGEKAGSIESETWFSLKDLGKLIHLRGSLKIRGLENVAAEASEAREAQLSTKTGLRRLTLCFDGGDNMEQETRIMDEAFVLKALQPPQDLHILGIESCNGPAYPSWMMSLTSLRSVDLSDCYNWERLPPMWKLPLLESLSICGNNKVKKLGEEFVGVETSFVNHNIIAFPNLKQLHFGHMPEWEEWEYGTVLGSGGGDDSSSSSSSNVRIMPKLQRLYIRYCPKLKALPHHLLQSRALHELMIRRCPSLTSPPSL